MKPKIKRFLSSTLSLAVILGMTQPVSAHAYVKVEDKEQNYQYEIYPTPQEINYTNDEFVIRKDVNVVYGSTIDNPTKKRMTEVLESKGKNVQVSNEVVKGKTNVLVGTVTADEYVDTYIEDKYQVDEDLFEKNDSYYMSVDDGEIAILGKNTDAAFYGVTNLKHIFNQMDGSTIKELEISDYADTPIRGFIEGYYGIPWTNEDRMSLMKFGGDFKMTSYIFAPKDDVFHARRWRDLYPQDQLEKIAEMVEVGRDTKTKFVWTAHPFMGGFNANDYRGEMDKLIAKFEQLYSVGVRQFGVLGDDVGNLNKQIVVDMMNELSEWGKKKGDVYDWVFCPGGYNHGWQGDYSELNLYDAKFPDNVQIFWTGQSVCAPISQETLTNFKTHRAENGKVRRSPLFWLNWPVNDINMKRLMLGKGSLLHTNINPNDLGGVVTNPMQDAEPSKVSIFAIADYSWNVNGFNDDESWKDSFKYVDSNAPESLYTIAKHTSDPSPNGHGLVLGESEEIRPLLEEFSNKLNGNQDISEIGSRLVSEMDIIIEACDDFVKSSKNARMVEQIKPYSGSLKDLALAIKYYVQASMDLKGNDNEQAVTNFVEGTTAYENSKNHDRIKLNGVGKAQPGSKRLVPFVESVRDSISEEINSLVNGTKEPLVFTASTNIPNIHSGKIEDIIDGKENTFIWNGQYEAKNQYYQVNLSKPTTIYGVDILNGTTGKPQDTFGHAKVQYTTNGEEWLDVNGKTYGPYATSVKIKGIEIKNVVGVRYICTATDSGNKWPAMREFKVLTTPEVIEAPTFTSEVIRTTDGWSVYGSGSEANMIDGNPETGVHFNVRQQGSPANTTIAGDYVGVKLSKPITLGKIKILQGPNASSGDYFKNATLEYSLDGQKYTEIKQCVDERNIILDLSSQNIEAQYIRLRNNANQPTWIGFREFEVKAKVSHNGKVYTNVEEYKSYPANYFNNNSSMVEAENITLSNGKFIGLKLDRIHELTAINLEGKSLDNLTLQVSKNAYEWTNLDDKTLSENTDARYIRLINLGDSEVTFDVNQFKVLSKEFEKPTVIDSNMGSIAEGKVENLFDKDRSTALKYQKTQVIGDYMIVDLGQLIDLNELKIVTHDSDKDYIRDGKVYVSSDKSNWGEAIITIGDQEPNTKVDDSNINESFPEHEISYNVVKAENINKKARYIKIEITQNYGHRWTRINEIEVNGGEYIPTVNDPTFDSNTLDTQNGLYEYLVDGDITTMYVPNSDKGNLVYSISDDVDVNYIKVMQNAKAISNALISARIVTNKKTSEWVELGKLNKATNEFVLPKGTKILDVKFEWNGTTPNLVELIFDTIADVNVDKNALQQLVDENLDITRWTANSKNKYNLAINIGREILSNEYVAQGTINSAIKEIEKAKESKELKGDASRIQEALDSKITEESKYTIKSWANYKKALAKAEDAMKDVENISELDVENLLAGLNEAKEALVYNPTNREEAEIILEDISLFISNIENPDSIYTKNSWGELLNAQKELLDLIELNKTEPQSPHLFDIAKKKLVDAKESLVNITVLVSMIAEFNNIPDTTIYTESSFKVYSDAVDKGNQLLVNGSKEAIQEAINKLTDAKNGLELAGSSEALKKFIDELNKLDKDKYTVNSYEELKNRVSDIEKMNLDSMSKEELDKYETELLTLKNKLVDVTALRNQVEIANKFDGNLYTVDSYNKLSEAINKSNEIFVSGTNELVDNLVNEIDSAIKALEKRVDLSELKNYLDSIEKIEEDKYTQDSLDKYNEALNEIKAMLENTENITAEEFIAAKKKFEDAKASLELNKVEPQVPDIEDPDTENPDTENPDTENPEIPDTDGQDVEGNNNNNNTLPENGNKVPPTGDRNSMVVIIFTLAIAGILSINMYKKRESIRE